MLGQASIYNTGLIRILRYNAYMYRMKNVHGLY